MLLDFATEAPLSSQKTAFLMSISQKTSRCLVKATKGKYTTSQGDTFASKQDLLCVVNNEQQAEWLVMAGAKGEGAFGTVYCCPLKLTVNKQNNEVTKERVNYVIKKIPLDENNPEKQKRKIANECKLCKAQKLVIPYYRSPNDSYYEEAKAFYIPFEDYGHNLAITLDDAPNMEFNKRLKIILSIINAMLLLSGMNIIHQDLKPENICIKRSNLRGEEQYTAYIIDFGLSSHADDKESLAQNAGAGSLLYMPVEIGLGGQGSSAGDIYSLTPVFAMLLFGSQCDLILFKDKKRWLDKAKDTDNQVQQLAFKKAAYQASYSIDLLFSEHATNLPEEVDPVLRRDIKKLLNEMQDQDSAKRPLIHFIFKFFKYVSDRMEQQREYNEKKTRLVNLFNNFEAACVNIGLIQEAKSFDMVFGCTTSSQPTLPARNELLSRMSAINKSPQSHYTLVSTFIEDQKKLQDAQFGIAFNVEPLTSIIDYLTPLLRNINAFEENYMEQQRKYNEKKTKLVNLFNNFEAACVNIGLIQEAKSFDMVFGCPTSSIQSNYSTSFLPARNELLRRMSAISKFHNSPYTLVSTFIEEQKIRKDAQFGIAFNVEPLTSIIDYLTPLLRSINAFEENYETFCRFIREALRETNSTGIISIQQFLERRPVPHALAALEEAGRIAQERLASTPYTQRCCFFRRGRHENVEWLYNSLARLSRPTETARLLSGENVEVIEVEVAKLINSLEQTPRCFVHQHATPWRPTGPSP